MHVTPLLASVCVLLVKGRHPQTNRHVPTKGIEHYFFDRFTTVARRLNIKMEISLGLVYETRADRRKRATDLLSAILRAHPITADLIIAFNRLDGASLNILALHW